MKQIILAVMAAVLLAAPAGYARPRMICKDTGKEVTSACCCAIKDGKFVCKMRKKTHTTCCCESKP